MSLKDYTMSFAHSASTVTMEAAQNPKVAQGTAIATTGTGFITSMGWIETNIGFIASALGIMLTLMLMWINRKKEQRDKEIHALDVERKRLQVEINKRMLNGDSDD